LEDDTGFYRRRQTPRPKNGDRSPSWQPPAQAALLIAPLFDCGALTFGDERDWKSRQPRGCAPGPSICVGKEVPSRAGIPLPEED